MADTQRDPMAKAKKPYHKEDLRGDLLAAGRSYIEQHGHLNLSMRTLAQQVEVSSGAPYHHFADRRAFLLALAAEGFDDMLSGASQAMADLPEPRARLRALGLHFLRFAGSNPHLLDLMYESELTAPTLDPQLLRYQVAAHSALRSAIQDAVPAITAAEADMRSIAFWSAIYGFASMRRKGVIHSAGTSVAIDNMVQAIVERAVLMAIAD